MARMKTVKGRSNGGAKMARFNMAWVTNGKDWKTFVKDLHQ
jgi:hypothetical protein